MSEAGDINPTESNTATDSDQDVARTTPEEADTKRGTDTCTSHSDQEQEQEKEKDDHPPFSLATLGLQRVGTVPPPKPKVIQQPIQMLNARGMPARIRKRNRFFFDENIINDDKPLRMRLSPKKLPIKFSGTIVHATPVQSEDNVTTNDVGAEEQRSLRKTKVTPAKVLEKRKGVVSRYMRTEPVMSKIRKNAVIKLKANAKKTQQVKMIKIKTKLPPPAKRIKEKKYMTGVPKIDRTKPAVSEASVNSDDNKPMSHKLVGQTIGLSLRNLLKLPKAHKWAIAEWFYSYIDRPLFEGVSEFEHFVRDMYPALKTRNLTRAEWRCLRRTMGKPRRCSQAFFDAERRELARKRMLLRTLQSRKPGDFKDLVFMNDMPDKIPMPLPVGTKVTARLRQPQDGIFNGSVDAYDSLNGMYRVTFERQGLGTHSISDYEVLSENFHEMLPLHTFTKDFRPNLISIFTGKRNRMPLQKQLVNNIMNVRSEINIKLNKSDPLLGQEAFAASSPYKSQLTRSHGYPSSLLESIIRLQRTSNMKQSKVQRQSDMNDEAELLIANSVPKFALDDGGILSHHSPISCEFQRRYASNIIAIEKLNQDAKTYLDEVLKLSASISRDPNVLAMVSPTFLREQCREVADKTVDRLNNSTSPVKNLHILKLIKNLAMLLIITSRIGPDNKVMKVLDCCMEEVQASLLSRDNPENFQKNVQFHLNHLASIITRLANFSKRKSLLAFKVKKNEKIMKQKKIKHDVDAKEEDKKGKKDKKDKKEKKENDVEQQKQEVTKNEQDQKQKHENDGTLPIDQSQILKDDADDDEKTKQNEESPTDQKANTDVKSNEQDQVPEIKDDTIDENKVLQDQKKDDNDDLAPIEQGQVEVQVQAEDETTTQSEQPKVDENIVTNEEQDQKEVHVHVTNNEIQIQEDVDIVTAIEENLVNEETDDGMQIERLEDEGDDDMVQEEPLIEKINENEQFEMQVDDIIETIEPVQAYETDETSQMEQLLVESIDEEFLEQNEDILIDNESNDQMTEQSQNEQFLLNSCDDDDDIEMGEEEHLIDDTDDVNSNEIIVENMVEDNIAVLM